MWARDHGWSVWDDSLAESLGLRNEAESFLVAAARQLEEPASVVQRQVRLGLGVDVKCTLRPPEPAVGVLEPSPGQHRTAEHRVRDTRGRVLGPAVAFGELHRLEVPLHRQLVRAIEGEERAVGKSGHLEVRAFDQVREIDAFVDVPFRIIESTAEELGDAEVDQRPRTEVVAELELQRIRGVGRRQQPFRFGFDGGLIALLPGEREPHDGEEDLEARRLLGQRGRVAGCQCETSLHLVRRTMDERVGGRERRELGVGRDHARREGREEAVGRGAPPVEDQADPVFEEQPRGQVPLLRRLRVGIASTTSPCSAYHRAQRRAGP